MELKEEEIHDPYLATTATHKVVRMTKRIRAVQGGTSAGKSIAILQTLIHFAQQDKKPTLTSIVSESLPHLKKGLIRDFLLIMNRHRYYKDDRWNRTDFTYTFETGSQIEFFSVDQPDKVRGPRRDRLFINEANNVHYEAFDQLEVRTRAFIYLDWNPTNEFWFYTDILPVRTDVEHIILTYKDNEGLDPNIIASIEQRKGNKQWWRVYGEGQLGEVEGKVYKNWAIINDIPHEAKLIRYGVDFGYTDPTAIVALYSYMGGYIVDEIAYQKEMSNSTIASILLNKEKSLIIADSAEPKSIRDIADQGLTIVGAEKGRDSVSNGIATVQEQKISITKGSINIIKEYRNYMWMRDKNDKVLPIPEHAYSHCFAPQAKVHTIDGYIEIEKLMDTEGYLYSRDNTIKRYYNVQPTRDNAPTVILTFDDNQTLEVTPDHLLLAPNGEWVEAGLLCIEDMIQSGTYDNNKWLPILQIQWFKILQRIRRWQKRVSTSLHMAKSIWGHTRGLSHTSQGQRHREQRHKQLRDDTQVGALETSQPHLDGGRETEKERLDKKDITTHKEVAWVRRGKGVAQVEWEECLRKENSYTKKLCTLPQRFFNSSIFRKCSLLPHELQNESKTKKVTGISRGFQPITYNLEVEDTHCLAVDGVIAHNSMDSIRYCVVSAVKKGIGNAPVVHYSNSARYGNARRR